VIYYKKYDAGVYGKLLEDDQFDISIDGLSRTYGFKNSYAIPFVIEWHIIRNDGADIPDDPTRRQLYKIKVKAELLINDETILSVTNKKDIPLSYCINIHTKEDYRYFPLLDCEHPLSCRFSDNCKLRITILKTDPRLKGLKGVLVVKPNTIL
jgi:hypothetical protein